MKRINESKEQKKRKDAAYAELIRLGRRANMSNWRRPPYAAPAIAGLYRQNMEGEKNMIGRKRMETPMLESWDAVDNALKTIAAANNELSVINGSMNMQIDALKEASDNMAKPYKEEIKKQELLIKEFVQANKLDMKGKSRKLTFGTVGFRMSTKLGLPKDIKKVIAALRKLGMNDCIATKESINKDVLKTYDEKEIIKVGGKLNKEDIFYYEIAQVPVSEG